MQTRGGGFLTPEESEASLIRDEVSREGKAHLDWIDDGFKKGVPPEVAQLFLEIGDQLHVIMSDSLSQVVDLKKLPGVRHLTVSSDGAVKHPEALGEVSLSTLRFMSWGMKVSQFLELVNPERLRRLALGPTKRSGIDLSPLEGYSELKCVGVSGHTKNFEAIGKIPQLEALLLRSIGKKQSLPALNEMTGLKALEISGGGRESIDEVNLPPLQYLGIGGVLGLHSLDDMGRFSSLKDFGVGAQSKIEKIDFSDSPLLESLCVGTMKGLVTLAGIEKLERLKSLRVLWTGLQLSELIERLSPNLKSVQLLSGRKTEDEKTRAFLDEKGYQEFSPDFLGEGGYDLSQLLM